MGVICFGALGHSNVSVATAVDIDGNVLVLNDLRRLREVDGEGADSRGLAQVRSRTAPLVRVGRNGKKSDS